MERRRLKIELPPEAPASPAQPQTAPAESKRLPPWFWWVLATGLLVLLILVIALAGGNTGKKKTPPPLPVPAQAQPLPLSDTMPAAPLLSNNPRHYELPPGYGLGESGVFDGKGSARMLLLSGFSEKQLAPLMQTAFGDLLLRLPPEGAPYFWLTNGEQTQAGLVFEEDMLHYVVVCPMNPSLSGRHRREVQRRKRAMAFNIGRGLHWTLSDSLHSAYQLSAQIDSALKWTVDLYHLPANSRMRLLFDELWVQNTRLGIGDLQALQLDTARQGGMTISAYAFTHRGKRTFYDPSGREMKSGFLAAPVAYTRISSEYGSRLHPILGETKMHYGTDFAAAGGSPIVAVADGKVLLAGYDDQNGNYVKLQHSSEIVTFYLHMNSRPLVSPGDQVKQNQVIGYVGQTGSATGPHVCYRMKRQDQPVNPREIQLPCGAQLGGPLRLAFAARKDSLDRLMPQ